MTQALKPPLDLVVCTVPWAEDQEPKEGEVPTSQVYCRAFLNGVELKRTLGVEVKSDAGFTEAILILRVAPASVRYEEITIAQMHDPNFQLPDTGQ